MVDPLTEDAAWIALMGVRIRELRERHGLTVSQLANRVSERYGQGISGTTIAQIEAGRTANVRTYARVARTLGVPPSTVFDPVDEARAQDGVRPFADAVHHCGYLARGCRKEVRLDLEGGAFVVHTIEGLHADWYKGRVAYVHSMLTSGEEFTRLAYAENPFEVLSATEGLNVTFDRLSYKRRAQEHLCMHRIEVPNGLGTGSVSYRYSLILADHYQVFAEAALIPDEAFAKYADPTGKVDVPPAELPALVAPFEEPFRAMSEKERYARAPCFAAVGCAEFPVERIVLTVRFPQGCRPSFVTPQFWSGLRTWQEARETGAALPCPAGTYQYSGGGHADPVQLRLEVSRPALNVSYGLLWWPAVFREFWPAYQAFLHSKGSP